MEKNSKKGNQNATELQQVGIKQTVKMGMASKRVTMEELARATGRELSTLSSMLSRGKPSLRSTLGVLEGLDAKLIVRYENGQEVELVIV